MKDNSKSLQKTTETTGATRVRISNVNLRLDRCIWVSLQDIMGIGRTTALKICSELNIEKTKKTKFLNQEEENAINLYIDKNLTVESSLKEEIRSNIKNKVKLKNYEGLRWIQGLPLRSRTKRNAHTARRIMSGLLHTDKSKE
jgi:small subunit ribosomal protein S13